MFSLQRGCHIFVHRVMLLKKIPCFSGIQIDSICLHLFKLTSVFPFTQLHITGMCCINHKIITLNNHFCCFFQRYSNASTNLSISYFSSASFNDCFYCYWKAHFISLPSIQFHGGMRKCCPSMLLTKI